MPRATRAAAAVLGPGALAAVLVAAAAIDYPDRPPPAHTGGFGEPTCRACHFGAELNASPGALTIRGVPPAYSPGERYRLTVRLTRAGMASAGFQLSARRAEETHGTRSGSRSGATERAGEQAGALRVTDDRGTVARTESTGVQYAQHTEAGTALSAPDTARWTVEWTAPDEDAGPVIVHAVGNAANHDQSAFGDVIYTTSQRIPSAPGAHPPSAIASRNASP